MLLYFIAVGFTGLQLSIQAVRSVQIAPLGLAVVAIAISYMCAAVTYKLLAAKTIGLGATFLVQVSSGLVNRLLPAGLGGLGINAYYLKKRGHTLPEAITVVAANNLLGFIGNLLLIALVSVIVPIDWPTVRLPAAAAPAAAVAGLLFALITVYLWRHRKATEALLRSLRDIAVYFRISAKRPWRAAGALCSSCLLTALHAGAMYIVLVAVGAEVMWPVALLAVSLGAFMGAAVPTPGGLGGAEAGIVAALVSFAVAPTTAIAAALIYRGITYWLPLIPGYIALQVVEKRYLY